MIFHVFKTIDCQRKPYRSLENIKYRACNIYQNLFAIQSGLFPRCRLKHVISRRYFFSTRSLQICRHVIMIQYITKTIYHFVKSVKKLAALLRQVVLKYQEKPYLSIHYYLQQHVFSTLTNIRVPNSRFHTVVLN